MTITISVTEEFLRKLDSVRGPTSRSGFIRWVLDNKVEWLVESSGVVRESGSKQVGSVSGKEKPVEKISKENEDILDSEVEKVVLVKELFKWGSYGDSYKQKLIERASKLGYRIEDGKLVKG